jgi:hypothetical protein
MSQNFNNKRISLFIRIKEVVAVKCQPLLLPQIILVITITITVGGDLRLQQHIINNIRLIAQSLIIYQSGLIKSHIGKTHIKWHSQLPQNYQNPNYHNMPMFHKSPYLSKFKKFGRNLINITIQPQ